MPRRNDALEIQCNEHHLREEYISGGISEGNQKGITGITLEKNIKTTQKQKRENAEQYEQIIFTDVKK